MLYWLRSCIDHVQFLFLDNLLGRFCTVLWVIINLYCKVPSNQFCMIWLNLNDQLVQSSIKMCVFRCFHSQYLNDFSYHTKLTPMRSHMEGGWLKFCHTLCFWQPRRFLILKIHPTLTSYALYFLQHKIKDATSRLFPYVLLSHMVFLWAFNCFSPPLVIFNYLCHPFSIKSTFTLWHAF